VPATDVCGVRQLTLCDYQNGTTGRCGVEGTARQ
jgi:hypothetical protein